MQHLILKCPAPECGHVWVYTGRSTGRVSCPVCNAYVTIRKNIVGAVEITYVVKAADVEEVLKQMACRPAGKRPGQDPELMKALEPFIKAKAKAKAK